MSLYGTRGVVVTGRPCNPLDTPRRSYLRDPRQPHVSQTPHLIHPPLIHLDMGTSGHRGLTRETVTPSSSPRLPRLGQGPAERQDCRRLGSGPRSPVVPDSLRPSWDLRHRGGPVPVLPPGPTPTPPSRRAPQTPGIHPVKGEDGDTRLVGIYVPATCPVRPTHDT